MGTFKGPLDFNGSVGGFNGYYDRDAKKKVIREKKGKNKNNNKHAPRALDQNREFKAMCILSKFIRRATLDIDSLKNGRLAGYLNRIAKTIQVLDDDGILGYRTTLVSKYTYPLTGFSFNNAHPFKEVFQVVPELSASEDRREVTLKLTNFKSKGKFKWPEKVGHYRIFLLIFVLKDLVWDPDREQYDPSYQGQRLVKSFVISEWFPVLSTTKDIQLSAAFREDQQLPENSTVVAVMGLEFASAYDNGTYYVVRDHGTAAIVGCL